MFLRSTTWSVSGSDISKYNSIIHGIFTKLKPCCVLAVWVITWRLGTTSDYFVLNCCFNLWTRHPCNGTAFQYHLYFNIMTCNNQLSVQNAPYFDVNICRYYSYMNIVPKPPRHCCACRSIVNYHVSHYLSRLKCENSVNIINICLI